MAPPSAGDNRPDTTTWTDIDTFHGMSAEDIANLAGAMEIAWFRPNDEIIRFGEEGTDMFVLEEGRVRVEVPARGDTKETLIRVLPAPAIFGEIALVADAPRTATVRALDNVRCRRMDRGSFDSLVRQYPPAARFLTRVVGERLLESGSMRRVGKYEIVGRLGSGGVATVFEGIHPGLNRSVALKMLSHSLVYHPGFVEHFKKEARLAAHLDHENIVRIFDTDAAWGTQWIVMERLSGTLLADLVSNRIQLSWAEIRRILRDICEGLDYSHRKGLLHRDIKPSNVFITDDRVVKLLDFGIAVEFEQSASTDDRTVGTPHYMAPEHIRGRQLDGRADQYATGILAYELITGEVPFDSGEIPDLLRKHLYAPMPDVRDVAADCPEDLVEFIQTATAKDLMDRFPSCGAAAKFLSRGLDGGLALGAGTTTIRIDYPPDLHAEVDDAVHMLHVSLRANSRIRVKVDHRRDERG